MVLAKERWSADAYFGLMQTVDDWPLQDVEQAIASGRCELWRVNGASWLVTEVQNDCLFIWAYAGMQARDMLSALIRIAQHNKLRFVRYHTRHRGLARLCNEFPSRLLSNVDGLRTYEIEVLQ